METFFCTINYYKRHIITAALPYDNEHLHIGHMSGAYLKADIYSRYKRLNGFNVLHPMGYDAFGLPAEQYAIQTGVHPADSTATNVDRYRKQLDNLGFCFDWDRQVSTCDPTYYKWTQWIFLQLFDHYYDLDANKAIPISALIKHFEENGNLKINAHNNQETARVQNQAMTLS